MAFTGPIEDRLAIREFYDVYADAANRADRAAWLGCYAEDGVWTTHYFDVAGREAIGRQYDQIMASVADTTFFTQLGALAVDGDSARARAFCQESLLQKDGGTFDLTGEYHDDLVRRDGRWFFARRTYLVKREKQP